MAVDCLVRVSFQTEPAANQAINEALVGDRQAAVGAGPFQRVNTAMYRVVAGRDADVLTAINRLAAEVNNHWDVLDFFGISMTKRSAVFDIEFEEVLRHEMEQSLTDVSRIELAIAAAAESRKTASGERFEVQAGPFHLACEQRGKGKGRSYFVQRA